VFWLMIDLLGQGCLAVRAAHRCTARQRQDSYLNTAKDIKAIPPNAIFYSAAFWIGPDLHSSRLGRAEYANAEYPEQRRKIAMHVEMRPIGTIRPYANNPRLNDAAVEAVAASIREFGFRQPIVVDEDGVIIVGHTRYKAALKLGLETVPVHVAVGLTPAQARAYRLADNQCATLSRFDEARLVQERLMLTTASPTFAHVASFWLEAAGHPIVA